MSRRAPNPAADRAAQNQQTIKTLLKLEGNKSCADCKRNRHPRWASWNLGVFVCIRCSGIHRGMGTHISRVKSVDLDAWTDEQLQSVLKWGNSRANKYWEAKLAAGHVPSEAKIENFIRTKYESKRWVMEGPMPDPATLDTEGDDDVPLNIVKEKAQLDRSSSQRASSSTQPSAPVRRPAPSVDLFGDDISPPVRPSTTDTPGTRAPPPKSAAPPKAQTKPADSLLGLDFFGGPPAAPTDRPASASANPAGSSNTSRPDLKQSILSLYASAPRPQPPSQPQHERQISFGGMQSPPMQSPQSQQPGFGGLSDAFSGLNFASPTSPPASQPLQKPKVDPFAGFSNSAPQRSSIAPPQLTSPPPMSGGGFFDTTPKPMSKPPAASKPSYTAPPAPKPLSMPNDDFGDFSFASSPPKETSKPAASNASNDLFGLSESSAPKAAPAPQKPAAPSINLSSAFNLSAPAPQQPKSAPVTISSMNNSFAGFGDTDAWGSNDAWATPEPATALAKAPAVKSPPIPAPSNDFAWGGTSGSNGGFGSQVTPKVTADEDFGGWSSAAPVSPPVTKPPPQQSNNNNNNNNKPNGGGFGGSDDLFSNVWG